MKALKKAFIDAAKNTQSRSRTVKTVKRCLGWVPPAPRNKKK